jgi:hypothetical protein
MPNGNGKWKKPVCFAIDHLPFTMQAAPFSGLLSAARVSPSIPRQPSKATD